MADSTNVFDSQAFLFAKNAGYADAEALATGQYQIQSNQAALLGRLPQYQDQAAKEQNSIQSDYESRGMSQSGGRVDAQNQAASALGHRMAADVNDTATQNQNIALEMARQLALTQQKIQDEQIASAQRTTAGNANTQLSPYL